MDLPSLNPEANLVFSPDEKYILTGTAGSHAGVLAGAAEEEKAKELEKNGGVGGKVVVLRREGLDVVRSLSASISHIISGARRLTKIERHLALLRRQGPLAPIHQPSQSVPSPVLFPPNLLSRL